MWFYDRRTKLAVFVDWMCGVRLGDIRPVVRAEIGIRDADGWVLAAAVHVDSLVDPVARVLNVLHDRIVVADLVLAASVDGAVRVLDDIDVRTPTLNVVCANLPP